MPVKIFLLGRPGSGKSTAARLIMKNAHCRGWSAIRIKDYDILYEKFQADTEHYQFRPTPHGGFDVIDLSVLDHALVELERKVQAYLFATEKVLLLIEFARDDYSSALKLFSSDFLQDAYFPFIDADLETCIQRIHRRITYDYPGQPKTDNHFVSDEILRNYYSGENKQYMTENLRKDFGIKKGIGVVDNTRSWREFMDAVFWFVDIIFWQEISNRKLASGNVSWPLLVLDGSRELEGLHSYDTVREI